MNLLEMEEMAKGMPKSRLIQEAQRPSGLGLPPFLVISELQRRNQMEKNYNAKAATTTVADDVTGIAQVSQSRMPRAMKSGPPSGVQAMAHGGVVRMSDGGESRAAIDQQFKDAFKAQTGMDADLKILEYQRWLMDLQERMTAREQAGGVNAREYTQRAAAPTSGVDLGVGQTDSSVYADSVMGSNPSDYVPDYSMIAPGGKSAESGSTDGMDNIGLGDAASAVGRVSEGYRDINRRAGGYGPLAGRTLTVTPNQTPKVLKSASNQLVESPYIDSLYDQSLKTPPYGYGPGRKTASKPPPPEVSPVADLTGVSSAGISGLPEINYGDLIAASAARADKANADARNDALAQALIGIGSATASSARPGDFGKLVGLVGNQVIDTRAKGRDAALEEARYGEGLSAEQIKADYERAVDTRELAAREKLVDAQVDELGSRSEITSGLIGKNALEWIDSEMVEIMSQEAVAKEMGLSLDALRQQIDKERKAAGGLGVRTATEVRVEKKKIEMARQLSAEMILGSAVNPYKQQATTSDDFLINARR
jgi:hypothetical protein